MLTVLNKKMCVALLVGAVTSLGLASAPAHASAPAQVETGAPQVQQANPCGWFTSDLHAYYNHCGNGKVVIFVDKRVTNDYYRCVGPGVTRLGLVTSTQGAWYDNRTC